MKRAASALQVYANNEGITAYLKHESTGESLTLGAKLPIDENSNQHSVIIEDNVTTKDGKKLFIQVGVNDEMVKQTRESLSVIYHCLLPSRYLRQSFSLYLRKKTIKTFDENVSSHRENDELERDTAFFETKFR